MNVSMIACTLAIHFSFLAKSITSLVCTKPKKDLLKSLEQADLEGKKAFAFDTKYKGRFAGSAGKGIAKKLEQLRMEIVKSHASAIVKGAKGPLEEGAKETFKQIGADIAKL